MPHIPLSLNKLCLEFPHKTCFKNFSSIINSGDHIAIVGNNGSGKSSLLNILKQNFESQDIVISYVPQIIDEHQNLSGGQRFERSFTQALSTDPDILLLDEPTNHLDIKNRRSLIQKLKSYKGTLIIVSHDQELLQNYFNIFWHIDNGKISIFSGIYIDYINEIKSKRASIENELYRLNKQKKDKHKDLMQEQTRAAKSKQKGKKSIAQKKWPTITSKCKAQKAQETTGNKKSAIDNKKQSLVDKLDELRLPEIISPKFSITSKDIGYKSAISIQSASIGYTETILENINLEVGSKNRTAILGDNASGKSTLIKSILNHSNINRTGSWNISNDVGYLDQNYSTLDNSQTVIEAIYSLVPNWEMSKIRCHLNDFLFRKNQEVNSLISTLSGGEKARLSLAQIAAKTPKLLILDEITNNLDLETKNHVIEVLNSYPGALVIISHDKDFLKEIDINDYYLIENKQLQQFNFAL